MTYRIAVLASGQGSNLQALIDATASGWLAARIVGVFSDKSDARALQRARDAGIPALALDPGNFASRSGFDAALFAQVDAMQPDLIVCAGYMRMIDVAQVEAHRNRMINLHPSLLPAFRGLRTHQRVLEAGAAEHGASVHVVTADLDGGPVIAQVHVPVLDGDSPDVLATRVGERERPLLVETVRWLADGRIALRDDGIHVDDDRLRIPLQLAANNRFA